MKPLFESWRRYLDGEPINEGTPTEAQFFRDVSQNATRYLNGIIQKGLYKDVNELATYLAQEVYSHNYRENPKEFIEILKQVIPQLQTLSKELIEANNNYVSTLNDLGSTWSEINDFIGDNLVSGQEQRAQAKLSPEERLKDRMRAAAANRKEDPEEWAAAKAAYKDSKGQGAPAEDTEGIGANTTQEQDRAYLKKKYNEYKQGGDRATFLAIYDAYTKKHKKG